MKTHEDIKGAFLKFKEGSIEKLNKTTNIIKEKSSVLLQLLSRTYTSLKMKTKSFSKNLISESKVLAGASLEILNLRYKLKLVSTMAVVTALTGFLVWQSGFSYKIQLDGTDLAYVKEITEVQKSIEEVDLAIVDSYGEKAYHNNKIEFEKVRTKDNTLVDGSALIRKILPKLDVFKPGNNVLVDGELALTVELEIEIDNVLASIKEDILKGISGESTKATFSQEITTEEKDVNVKDIYPEEVLRMVLDPNYANSDESEYDVATVSAVNYSGFTTKALSEDDISALEKYPLELVSYVEEVKKEEIDFKSKTEKDSSLYVGTKKVKQEGKKGEKEVTYEIKYVNGKEVSTNKVSEKVTKEVVDKITLEGSKAKPAPVRKPTGSANTGNGKLAWPMKNARITAGWYGYAGHQAIDIQSVTNNGYGPIYAAESGVVVDNRYSGGWGNMIKIRHDNGLETLYAHMEAPGYYKVGQRVSRGTQIGYVGMTGRTTGPHVHFEVYQNGRKVNPCNFIGC